MADKSTGAIIELEGILGEILPTVFRSRLPQLLDAHRNRHVRMVVTTRLGKSRQAAQAAESYFRPAREGRPAEFTWCAADLFHAVIRQFRFDFLHHLGPEELRVPIALGIYLDLEAERRESQAAANAAAMLTPPANTAVAIMPAAPSASTAANAPESPAPVQAQPAMAGTTVDEKPAPDAVARGPQPIPFGQPHPPAHLAGNGESAALAPLSPANGRPAARPARQPLTGAGSRSLPGNFYQDYYGFELMPFNNTPDSHFFFPTQKHQEALSRLIYAISERKGFVMISGEIGSGKSTLCRTLLGQLPREVKTALITHTHIEANQIVQAIAEDLGLETSGRNRYEILQLLNEYLVEQLAAGCTVCIIIDEAQNLSPAALEEVRMISNLETEQEKLVQLILLGQPDLRDKIHLPELRQLRQRISVQYHLEPLDRTETLGYIRHRLKIANPAQPLRFGSHAMHEVYRYSGGVPRLINSLCDNALLTAFTRQQRAITARLIQESARDMDLDPQYGSLGQYFRFW